MEQKEKELYNSPAIEVVVMKPEGIVCTSDLEGSGNGFIWDLL